MASTEQELVELYARAVPSLVQVRLIVGEPAVESAESPELLLSGVVLAEVEGGSLVCVPGRWEGERVHQLAVIDFGGRSFEVESVAVAQELGLSLLRVDGMLLEAPPFGFPATMPIGSSVVLLGNGFGLAGSMSVGLLSGRNRQLDELGGLLQITNPVHPGDAGGLLLDRKGRLVGLALTSLADRMARRAGGFPVDAQAVTGISFAIPIAAVLEAFREPLALPEVSPRPTLGVQVQEAPLPRDLRRALQLEQRTALFVRRVEPGRPAAEAGLQAGDYLIGLDGRPVRSFACLFSWVRQAGDVCPVQFVRGQQIFVRDVQVRWVDPKAMQPSRPRFGTQASPALVPDESDGGKRD